MELFFLLLCQTVIYVAGSPVVVSDSGLRRKNRRRDKENDSNDDKKSSDSKAQTWVVDSIFYDDYQSDAPSGSYDSQDACPPVPEVITDDACAHDTCQKDTDCTDGLRCCFTGCSFTCLPEVKPAAVVDWRKEPRRSRSGISWLIKEPKDQLPRETIGEECNTGPVEPDEDPLLCPDGYYCHITETEKSKRGHSNSGYCVKENDSLYSPGEEALVMRAALKQRAHCLVDNIVLLEGASVRLDNKTCRCKNGYLSCKERKKKTHKRKKSRKNKPNKSRKGRDKEKNVTS